MKNPSARGMTLIEILMTVGLFVFVVVPIIGVYSYSIESVKMVHSRSITYSAAQELLNQLQIVPPDQEFETGAYRNYPATGGRMGAFSEEGQVQYELSPFPESFVRVMEIPAGSTASRTVTVAVADTQNPRSRFSWARRVSRARGGR